jgi:hypothetical protein
MKKIVYLFLSLLTLLSACNKSDDPVIPMDNIDERFKEYLLETFDLNKDGFISDEEAALVKKIDCSGLPFLYSLEGIQYFPNLEHLICSNTSLSDINLSQNPKLQVLDCSNSNVRTIDVSLNSELQTLLCSFSQITTIDVSKNQKLKTLMCDHSRIQELDVSQSLALEYLNCDFLFLTSLKTNPTLKILEIRRHRLYSLDFRGNQFLKELYCEGENLVTLDVSNSVLDSLDCGSLTYLNVEGCNSLKTLSFNANDADLNCPKLENLSTGIHNLDVSKCPSLKKLTYSGRFDKLDFSQNP